MTYDQYVAEWNGKQVTRFGGECVAGIAEYEAENNLPIVYGNADTWIDNGLMLSAYDWVANNPSDLSQIPPRAAIVVWNGNLPNSGNAGHIAFFDHDLTDNEFMSFGQNAGGVTMHMQPMTWTDVAGWYVPKQVAVVHPYTIEPIASKQVKLNKDTHLWNLNYDNFTEINANPLADAIAGTIITVNANLHHNIGYNYYLTDPSVASGYNVLDADDYTPPPPAPPTGPMAIPSSDTYDIVKEISGYTTSNSAINHTGPEVTIPIGTYSVFNKRFDTTDPTELLAVNVTKTNGMAGAWVNVKDNVEDVPEPEPEVLAETTTATVSNAPLFASTYKELPAPKIYVAMRDLPVTDLAGTKTVTMPKYSVTKVSGTFIVNGIEYARPLSATQKDMWYGIEMTDRATGLANIELESDVYNAKTTIADRQVTHTLKTVDKLALAASHLRNSYLSIVGFFVKIKSEAKNKK